MDQHSEATAAEHGLEAAFSFCRGVQLNTRCCTCLSCREQRTPAQGGLECTWAFCALTCISQADMARQGTKSHHLAAGHAQGLKTFGIGQGQAGRLDFTRSACLHAYVRHRERRRVGSVRIHHNISLSLCWQLWSLYSWRQIITWEPCDRTDGASCNCEHLGLQWR